MTPAPPAGARALLSGLVDYAGLFPPAELPLDRAISNFASYRHQLDGWLLGRFVVPASQLPALNDFAYLFDPDLPFAFAVLGSGGPDRDAWIAQLQADQIAIARFERRHQPAVTVPLFEVRLPGALFAQPDPVAITSLLQKAAEDMPVTQQPFYENPLAPTDPNWEAGTKALAVAIAAFNETGPAHPAGFKLRCGGMTRDRIPSPAQVALAAQATAAAAIPVKATAGLHHPLRNVDATTGEAAHGFLNVIGAALLARVTDLDVAALTQVVADEDASHFQLGEDGFSWKEQQVAVPIIEAHRAALPGFGSCSFDEPRADLRALGIL